MVISAYHLFRKKVAKLIWLRGELSLSSRHIELINHWDLINLIFQNLHFFFHLSSLLNAILPEAWLYFYFIFLHNPYCILLKNWCRGYIYILLYYPTSKIKFLNPHLVYFFNPLYMKYIFITNSNTVQTLFYFKNIFPFFF